jgi:glucan phosphoethanolaminetransferase (alkaline phosphatase superfamily)
MRGSRIKLRNAYDIEVLYNDKVVYAMLNMIHDSTKDYSVIYLSDYSEYLAETWQFTGHMGGPAPKQVYQVRYFLF